jgi:uncharacterized protein with von Willebrand factor type A (vWA) domain
MDTALPPDPVHDFAEFATLLRGRGVAADTSRLLLAMEALSCLAIAGPDDVYWAGRLTLCAGPDDITRYDAAFDEWFFGRAVPTQLTSAEALSTVTWSAAGNAETSDAPDDEGSEDIGLAASEEEVLRRRDVLEFTDADREAMSRMVAALAPRTRRRRTRRRRPGRGPYFDLRRTTRTMVRDGGEPGSLVRARRKDKPRPLVLVLDVSGSMSPYADLFLRFAHAAVRVAPSSTEVFTVGTRLTRLTRQLRGRDAQDALQAAADAIPDWSGGTRLGESLRAFLDIWGQRGTARGSVVVIASDGWERGDASLLAEQMARLARLAHRVLWINPHRGRAGFAPATAGMTAALPYIDELLAGHTVDALSEVAEVIACA